VLGSMSEKDDRVDEKCDFGISCAMQNCSESWTWFSSCDAGSNDEVLRHGSGADDSAETRPAKRKTRPSDASPVNPIEK
jgi:hypothetical protein